MVIDLDRFKQVNDSVGIAVGDSILLTLARRLGRLLKPQDTLARLAGDQFALILLSEKDPDRILAFAETLRRGLRAPITFNDREIFLTASIGHRAPRRAAAPHRRGAQGRRARDVSRQAHRRRPHRGVQALDARAQDRPADAGIGIAPRARARGDHHPLSADRAARGPFGRRLRGAGALGSSQDGAAVRLPNSSRSPRRSG